MEAPKTNMLLESVLLAVCLIAYLLIWAYSINMPSAPKTVLSASFDLLIGMAILFVVILAAETYGRIVKNKETSYEFVSLIRLIGYPALVVDVLGAVGINVTSLLVGAGFLGIVVGLAAQTTLGNIFAGFSILYTKPFKAGDKISVSTPQYSIESPSHPHGMLEVEITGFVKAIGMIHTKMLRDDMTLVFIPNSVINTGLITNYSRAPERLIVLRADLKRRVNTKALKKKLSDAFKSKDFDSIKDLTLHTATITTDSDVGIIVTARVPQLDYPKMREAMADKFNEVLWKSKR